MQIKDIRTPEDILAFMVENIKYGWLDYNGQKHIGEMKNVRKLYKNGFNRRSFKTQNRNLC